MAIVISGTGIDMGDKPISNVSIVDSASVVDKAYVDDLKIIATGTATFTATTNNINLTGIGIGVEVGDVIQISGAIDAKNNSEFTVEVITDANNIIVNQAHANKGTTKNVAAQAVDAGVTVKLLAKWYNASEGLGQDWVDMLGTRSLGIVYQNVPNRTIGVSVGGLGTVSGNFLAGGSTSGRVAFTGIQVNNQYAGINFNIDSSYSVSISGGTLSGMYWYERR